MLVLARKAGQSVVIDGRIKVTLLRIQGNRIRLGIDAPRETPILREELPAAVAAGGGRPDCAPERPRLRQA